MFVCRFLPKELDRPKWFCFEASFLSILYIEGETLIFYFVIKFSLIFCCIKCDHLSYKGGRVSTEVSISIKHRVGGVGGIQFPIKLSVI